MICLGSIVFAVNCLAEPATPPSDLQYKMIKVQTSDMMIYRSEGGTRCSDLGSTIEDDHSSDLGYNDLYIQREERGVRQNAEAVSCQAKRTTPHEDLQIILSEIWASIIDFVIISIAREKSHAKLT